MQNDTPLISTEPLANLRTHDFEWSCDKLREIFKREREREIEREREDPMNIEKSSRLGNHGFGSLHNITLAYYDKKGILLPH